MTFQNIEPGTPYELLYGCDTVCRDELGKLMAERLGYGPGNIYQSGAAAASNSGPKAAGISFTRKKEQDAASLWTKVVHSMKIGVIDAGGGFRGVYACGVLDYCLDENIRFDLGIGISAGSANIASYIAGQRGRNYLFYTKYGLRKQYASVGNFIRKRSFIDVDYVYSTLSNHGGENPLDYTALRDDPMEFIVVAANAITGEPKYFDKQDMRQDDYDILKASSSIPFICKPYFIQGTPYYDGALGNPIPLEKAFLFGCDRVVVLLTKPESVLRTSKQDEKLAARIRKKYPNAAEKLRQRARRYNEGVALAQKYAKQGKVLIVAPDDTCGVSTLSRDPVNMRRLYEKGYTDGQKIKSFIGVYEGEK